MSAEDEAFKVRVLASIKLLRKASEVATDPKLKQMLLEEAEKLSKLLDASTTAIEEGKTIEKAVEELRNWIWSTKIETRSSPASKFDKLLDNLLNDFENKIKRIEQALEGILK